jgi:prophage ps3 protein 14, transcriptional regulator
MINKVKGYRNMINLSQKEMAELLGISFTSYCHKEQGKRDFKDNEKIIFLEIVKKSVPNITIEEIFFSGK